jgi:hypothetical protein
MIGIDASLLVRNNGHRVNAIFHPTFLMIAVDIIGGPVDLLPILTELHCRSSRLCVNSSSTGFDKLCRVSNAAPASAVIGRPCRRLYPHRSERLRGRMVVDPLRAAKGRLDSNSRLRSAQTRARYNRPGTSSGRGTVSAAHLVGYL